MLTNDGRLVPPPGTSGVLEGITVDTVAAENLGIALERREIDRTELYAADGVFLGGTPVGGSSSSTRATAPTPGTSPKGQCTSRKAAACCSGSATSRLGVAAGVLGGLTVRVLRRHRHGTAFPVEFRLLELIGIDTVGT